MEEKDLKTHPDRAFVEFMRHKRWVQSGRNQIDRDEAGHTAEAQKLGNLCSPFGIRTRLVIVNLLAPM